MVFPMCASTSKHIHPISSVNMPHQYPGAQDIGLIVEVADTTLQRDRNTKKQLYAREGIPIYWIINLVERQIEVYTEPSESSETPD